MLLTREFRVGDVLWGSTFTFEHAGDVFPVHVHNENDNHITILAFGAVRLLGQHEGTRLEAQPGGTIINWKAGEPHGFEALTDGATIINLLKRRP